MKYLKLFELFSDKKINFNLIVSDDDEYIYTFYTDGEKYKCSFYLAEKYRYWERAYTLSGKYLYDEINKNPYNIVSTVTNITMDFLERINPDALLIDHIYMDNEKRVPNKLNKRANINYQYLKNIKGYKIDYYNANASICCILHKKEFDCTNIVNSMCTGLQGVIPYKINP